MRTSYERTSQSNARLPSKRKVEDTTACEGRAHADEQDRFVLQNIGILGLAFAYVHCLFKPYLC